ncbi:MAG TPA: glutamate-5-semialdehyde dehydrogenase [Opitutales bacterium]|nr:glutamate-5-semialdehyde dehydrogenase [Opitutales bacterium]
MNHGEIEQLVETMAKKARTASLRLAQASTNEKNQVLLGLADLLEESSDAILAENEKDLADGRKNGLNDAMLDRLLITPERLKQIALSVRQVSELDDPVGETIETITRPNGLEIRKIRVPIGVIGIIYESRPNVTIDCAVLCLKSGNASLLRGGREAFHTNTIFASLISRALEEGGLSPDAVQLIPTTDRYALNCMLKQDANIHCIIPRGGAGLIRFVAENSLIPVIKHFEGVCHVYIDENADAKMANEITINSKCQRPGVCNAAETLLIHETIATDLLPQIAQSLAEQEVELRVDEKAAAILGKTEIPFQPAKPGDWTEEYLAPILAIKVAPSLEAAIDHINAHGSGHSDAIVTADETAAQKFLSGVDSAAVYWNASTRFTDGFQFGMGAEIGISTDRLHARGPMGLKELCSYKFTVTGNGQII